jgi:phosphoribosylformimino-5-aminoimidazole carboxamide ribonucleotide (ProFAR) isomerase
VYVCQKRLQYQNYLQRKPLVAKEFEAHGIEYLHLVDLDGAKSSQIVNYKILEQIATQTI